MNDYTPAGIASKAIDHLRTHPPGTWLCSAVIAEAVAEHSGTVAAFLKLPVERQWLRRRKEGNLCYWALGPLARLRADAADRPARRRMVAGGLPRDRHRPRAVASAAA